MLYQNRTRGIAIRISSVDEAADKTKKSLQLRFRVMKTSRARPSIRTAEDCRVPMGLDHSRQLGADQAQRALPRHRYEAIAATPFAGASGTMAQPSLADRRLSHAATMMHGIWN